MMQPDRRLAHCGDSLHHLVRLWSRAALINTSVEEPAARASRECPSHPNRNVVLPAPSVRLKWHASPLVAGMPFADGLWAYIGVRGGPDPAENFRKLPPP